MPLETLSTVIAALIVLSIASERLVEIIKGFVPLLDEKNEDPRKESIRRACLHILAVLSGILTALLAREALGASAPEGWNTTTGIIALGLLASGGSGFWNSVLGYVNEVKNIKKSETSEVEKRKA